MAKSSKTKKTKTKKSYYKIVWDQTKKPKNIASIIVSLTIALIIFISGRIILPGIKKAFFNHIRLAATIQPSSTIFIDGTNLNLLLQCQITNHTPHNINIYKFFCYYRKKNFWTKLKIISDQAGKIDVMNFEPLTDISKEALPPEAFGFFNVYINMNLPNQIEGIKELWESNEFELTYGELIEIISLIPKEIILVVQTNPPYKDDAIIHLFQKHQKQP